MATDYQQKLLNPRWQKRRLSILNRDNFTCQLCGDTESTLHVHHKTYRKVEVWEYEDEELITYCSICHLVVEFLKYNSEFKEPIFLEKEIHHSDPNQVNIFVLLREGEEYFICILFLNRISNKLTLVLGMKKNTLNKINSLVNEYSNNV